MPWLLVVVAGLFETGFALALKASDGLSKLVPSLTFVACAAVSFGLLTKALRDLPVGPAYAVWTGIGATGTAVVGMLLLGESASLPRVVSLGLVITGIVGLTLTEGS